MGRRQAARAVEQVRSRHYQQFQPRIRFVHITFSTPCSLFKIWLLKLSNTTLWGSVCVPELRGLNLGSP